MFKRSIAKKLTLIAHVFKVNIHFNEGRYRMRINFIIKFYIPHIIMPCYMPVIHTKSHTLAFSCVIKYFIIFIVKRYAAFLIWFRKSDTIFSFLLYTLNLMYPHAKKSKVRWSPHQRWNTIYPSPETALST